MPLLLELRILLLDVPLEDDPDRLVFCFKLPGCSVICSLVGAGAVGTVAAGGISVVSEEFVKPEELIGCVGSSLTVDAPG